MIWPILRICGFLVVAVFVVAILLVVYRYVCRIVPPSMPERSITAGIETSSDAFRRASISAMSVSVPMTPTTTKLLELPPTGPIIEKPKPNRNTGGCCDGDHPVGRGCPRIVGRSTVLYDLAGLPRELISIVVDYVPVCCIRSKIDSDVWQTIFTNKSTITENGYTDRSLRSMPYDDLRRVDECPSLTLNYLRWLVCALAAAVDETGISHTAYDMPTDTVDTVEAKLWTIAAAKPDSSVVKNLIAEANRLNHPIGGGQRLSFDMDGCESDCNDAELDRRLQSAVYHDTVGAVVSASLFPERFDWMPILTGGHRCAEHDPAVPTDGPEGLRRWSFPRLVDARIDALSTRIALRNS